MKLRNLQRAFLAIAVALCSWLPTLAYDIEVDYLNYNILSSEDKTLEVAGLNDENIENVVIPSKVYYDGDYYSVVAIGNYAFYECSKLRTVELCSTIKTICDYAFCDCTSLTSIDIPNSVETIGVCAFGYCISLTSIDIPDSVETIGDYAFYNCSALNMVEFGASVESIGKKAFWRCYELREVYSRATTPPVCTDIFEQETTMGTLFVPTGCKSVYAETFPWNAFWTIEELGSLGVEGVAADEVEVKAVGGSIVFDSATEASIYSSAGILVASGVMTEVELPAGLYIVVAGDKSHKIIVR